MPVKPFLCVVTFALVATSVALASEKKIQKSQVPAVVLDAFSKTYPGAQVKGYTTERENGKTVFEVESMKGGQTLDVSFAATGEVLSTEEGIDLADVPAAVSESVRKQYRGASIVRAEKVIQKGRTLFELGLRNASKKEALYSADGTVAHE